MRVLLLCEYFLPLEKKIIQSRLRQTEREREERGQTRSEKKKKFAKQEEFKLKPLFSHLLCSRTFSLSLSLARVGAFARARVKKKERPTEI
jgi:hypothetical protein